MRYEELSKRSRDYIDRYIRCSNKTREDALKEAIVKEVVNHYESEKTKL